MASLNKAILIGNLGQDPEVRYAPSGDAISNVSVATSESWKDKTSGEKRESVEWHRVVFFGKLAEIAGQYLKKGSQVYVEGRIQTRKWQDKDGQDRYTTEIRADTMKMLGGKAEGGEAPRQSAPQQRQDPQRSAPSRQPAPAAGGFAVFSDDIPFNRLGAGASWRVI